MNFLLRWRFLRVSPYLDTPMRVSVKNCGNQIHKSSAGLQSNLNPASNKMISDLLNCAELKFVSHTSNLSEQMYDFRTCTMFHLMQILSPQDLPQNRNLETAVICFDEQCYPHEKYNLYHMCDECMKSIDSGVCHWFWSIFVIDCANLFTSLRATRPPRGF